MLAGLNTAPTWRREPNGNKKWTLASLRKVQILAQCREPVLECIWALDFADTNNWPSGAETSHNIICSTSSHVEQHIPCFGISVARRRHWSMYSGRKITASLGNVTVRGGKDGKSKGWARWPTVCLSMYSITENIYYSQLTSLAILLQTERNCFTSYNTRKGLGSLSLYAIVLRSSVHSHVCTCNTN
jgi:hypothetical protein